MRRNLLALLIFLSASIVIVVSEFSDVAAATKQGSCSHFSESYNALNCFFSGGNAPTGSGVGGGGSYECPGGSEASCVECDGTTCQWACSGGLSCRFFKQPGGERMCATTRVCRTL